MPTVNSADIITTIKCNRIVFLWLTLSNNTACAELPRTSVCGDTVCRDVAGIIAVRNNDITYDTRNTTYDISTVVFTFVNSICQILRMFRERTARFNFTGVITICNNRLSTGYNIVCT